MSPECSNCEEWVSQAWKRTNAVDGEVLYCPNCMSVWDRHEMIKEGIRGRGDR